MKKKHSLLLQLPPEEPTVEGPEPMAEGSLSEQPTEEDEMTVLVDLMRDITTKRASHESKIRDICLSSEKRGTISLENLSNEVS